MLLSQDELIDVFLSFYFLFFEFLGCLKHCISVKGKVSRTIQQTSSKKFFQYLLWFKVSEVPHQGARTDTMGPLPELE